MEDDIRCHLEAGRNRVAFDLLVERFKDKVFHLAWSMVRNQAQAEDLAQDVFVKIWKHLATYKGDASLSTWIYTITRNTCLTELKKCAARWTVSLEEPEFDGAPESMRVLQSPAREMGVEQDVHYLLAQLSPKYRQVITLFYLEDRSYEEMSAMLGLPLGTVKTFLHRAKKELFHISRRPVAGPAMLQPPVHL